MNHLAVCLTNILFFITMYSGACHHSICMPIENLYVGFSGEVDAGEDIVLCNTPEVDTARCEAHIDSMISVERIIWSSEPYTTLAATYYASDYLSDTTVLNPLISGLDRDSIVFTLIVVDEDGMEYSDSMTVFSSDWPCHTGDSTYPKHCEDTVRLMPACSSNFPIVEYIVEPDYNISIRGDTILAWPDSSITYHVTSIDSKGCQYTERFHNVICLREVRAYATHTWTFEEEYYIGGGHAQISPDAAEFQATLYQDGAIHYGDRMSPPDFYSEDNKMYFWDDDLKEYVMHFDFESTTQYEIRYWNPFVDSMDVATVIVDSTSYRYFGSDSLAVQHVTVVNSATLDPYVVDVYEGIGASYYDTKIVLGCGLCDNNPITTRLRCFSNDSMTYNFVDVACDSSWAIVNTIDLKDEDFTIYPNPTSHILSVEGNEGSPTPYKLLALDGKLIDRGIVSDNELKLPEGNGIFILQLFNGNTWHNHKVVKVE